MIPTHVKLAETCSLQWTECQYKTQMSQSCSQNAVYTSLLLRLGSITTFTCSVTSHKNPYCKTGQTSDEINVILFEVSLRVWITYSLIT